MVLMKQFDHGRTLHLRWNILVEFVYSGNKNKQTNKQKVPEARLLTI
jgi:hypothetical protein